MFKKAWSGLRQRCQTCARVTLITGTTLIGLMIGGLFMLAGAAGLAWTNQESFCIGCHEMRENVYAEFKGTIHDTNRSGVRAICPDCHVPREVGPLLLRKARASFELWGHFVTGVIDTPEKFKEHRYTLAKRVVTRARGRRPAPTEVGVRIMTRDGKPAPAFFSLIRPQGDFAPGQQKMEIR